MRIAILGVVAVVLAGGYYFYAQQQQAPAAAPYPSDQASLTQGQEIAEIMCGLCHATGTSGASPMAEAPAFRDLSKRYPIEHLEEGLAEGLVAGHDQMPEVEFEPEEIDAFLGYLASIQVN
ncbi:cytochrome c [Roseibium sediminis]|uniref:cytochrome c n=1 Tax=Roseibium sediminis TaxID=1775174 RepID=UPI00123C9C9E|nr:cytochrome c [Roseibium sediminis]